MLAQKVSKHWGCIWQLQPGPSLPDGAALGCGALQQPLPATPTHQDSQAKAQAALYLDKSEPWASVRLMSAASTMPAASQNPIHVASASSHRKPRHCSMRVG